MKKVVCIVLCLVALFCIVNTFADAPHNAALLAEYEKLLKGAWNIVSRESFSGTNADIMPGSLIYYDGPDSTSGERYILFATSNDEVWLGLIGTGSGDTPWRKKDYFYLISFSKDGQYMMLINEARSESLIYKKE